jgi:predicted nucleic acid-binding Zn ribbon protein
VIRSLGLGNSLGGWTIVVRWPEIIGEQYAKHARAIRFDDGVLYVAIPDDGWRQHMAMDQDTILKRIQTFPGGRVVKKLRLVRDEKGLR